MAIVVLCVGAFLTLLGIAGYIHGMDLLPTERGMAGVISSSVVLVGGVLTLGLGLLLRRVEEVLALLPRAGVAKPASPAEAAPRVEPVVADPPRAEPSRAEPVIPLPDELPLPPVRDTVSKPTPATRPQIQPATVVAGITGALAGAAATASLARDMETPGSSKPDIDKPEPSAPVIDLPAPDAMADPLRKPITLPKLDFSLRREAAKEPVETTPGPARGEDTEYPLEVLTPVEDSVPMPPADDEPPMAMAEPIIAPPIAAAKVAAPIDLGLGEFEAEFEKLMQEPLATQPLATQPLLQESLAKEELVQEELVQEGLLKEPVATPAGLASTVPDLATPAEAVDAAEEEAEPDLDDMKQPPLRITLPPVAPLTVAPPATDPADVVPEAEDTGVDGAAAESTSDMKAEPAIADAASTDPTSENEPAKPVEKPKPAPGAEVVGAYESGGAKYTMYSDGSVIAEAGGETLFFKSLEELREFIDSGVKT